MTESAIDPEQFIAEAGVDDSAKQKFLALHPDVQQGIVSLGPLSGARNPSAALIGRIRSSEKDQFIIDAGVDQEAADAFGKLSAALQKEVMSRGTFNGSKNPSAVLLGRIRDARKSVAAAEFTAQNFAWGAMPRMMPSPAPAGKASGRWSQGVKRKIGASPDAVEQFIAEGGVDEEAAQSLRELPPAMQSEVLSRGGLETSRNPSAVLIGRIRQVKKGDSGSFGGGYSGMAPLLPVVSFTAPATKVRKKMTPIVKSEYPMDVESFIAEEGVDEKAAEGLRELDDQMQQAIMSRGTLKGGKNPSAMLIGRIRDAKATFGMSSKVDQFIQDEGVDDRAAEGLRELDPEMQERIIGRGTLAGAANPSAMLIGRIAAAKKQSNQMPGFGGVMPMWMGPPMMAPMMPPRGGRGRR